MFQICACARRLVTHELVVYSKQRFINQFLLIIACTLVHANSFYDNKTFPFCPSRTQLPHFHILVHLFCCLCANESIYIKSENLVIDNQILQQVWLVILCYVSSASLFKTNWPYSTRPQKYVECIYTRWLYNWPRFTFVSVSYGCFVVLICIIC